VEGSAELCCCFLANKAIDVPAWGSPCSSSPANLSKASQRLEGGDKLPAHVASLAMAMTVAVSVTPVT
jgi:hypothetical protein